MLRILAGLGIGLTWLLLSSVASRQPPSKLKAQQPADITRLAPAGLHIGSPMGWHTIYREPDNRGALANLVLCVVGDYGPGEDRQLLLRYTAATVPPVLLSATGKPQILDRLPVLGISGPAWDFNADGVDEVGVSTLLGRATELLNLAPESPERKGLGTQGLSFMDLSGKLIGSLPIPDDLPGISVCLDADGDGQRELLLQGGVDPDTTLNHFLPGGRLHYSRPGRLSPLVNVCADTDGDGRDERIIEDYAASPPALISTDADGKRLRYPGWPRQAMASFAQDINRDGRDEIFCSQGYCNPELNDFIAFDQPVLEWDRLQKANANPTRVTSEAEAVFTYGRALVGDFNHDNTPDAFVYGGVVGSAALLYSLDGRCQSYEELGEAYYSAHKLVQDGKDYVALVMKDRVLLAP